MKSQMEYLNPFTEDWNIFGFEGEPEPGFDYSWIQVQDNLSFFGYKSVISDCTLFYSSRRPNIYLAITPSKWGEVWNLSNLTFSRLASNGSILIAYSNERCIHISNVTSSFIGMLVKTSKLPEINSELTSNSNLQQLKLNIKIIRKYPNIPSEATTIETKEEANPSPIVTITGSAFSMNIQGTLNFKDNSEIVVTYEDPSSESWRISFDEINRVESTKIGRIFVVLYTIDDKRYEIGFNESNAIEANDLIQAVKKAIESRSKLE
ncbi:hypothetical protein M9Y10_029205 [Tritrichomonas musculus]|uniref:Uncharacterized protein n=1 Tax=Tritrichomonas musculus TaxID=1915356 RepID=A0ABR2KLG6_9EUKA